MKTADDFLKQKHLFQLGDLPTETPHPKTRDLSTWANHDLDQALNVMREVDLAALKKVLSLKEELTPLFQSIADTLRAGDTIYLVGCGATGRLSLSLEYLWRRAHPDSEQVISLMAGGDVALVHSLEGFEDFPEFGARHLRELGFSGSDLLIGSTEGGETPYVIGAVEEATRLSRRAPLFLYCNPKNVLMEKVERSRRVLTNPGIHAFSLDVGPMALTGSTRMQASTVLQLVIGLAFEFGADVDSAFAALQSWIRFLQASPVTPLKPFIMKESEVYMMAQNTIYSVDGMAITVFTDTTERAPTFNQPPFDNPLHLTERKSLTYLMIPSVGSSPDAWRKLLARTPRPLDWPEVHPKATSDYLQTFDFSARALNFRRQILPKSDHQVFEVGVDRGLTFRFMNIEEHFPLPQMSDLFDHLTLKMLLNMHSTLVMGRLGRFEGNLMTWVYPSNGKLVDRAARYTGILLNQKGHNQFSYEDIVRAQFACKAKLNSAESIVHKSIKLLLAGDQKDKSL